MLHRPVEPAQYAALTYTQALLDAGITGSVGTVGDALDNGLMESAIGLFKTGCIYRRSRWVNAAEVERETAIWVHWNNTERIHTSLNLVPPCDYERCWAAWRRAGGAA